MFSFRKISCVKIRGAADRSFLRGDDKCGGGSPAGPSSEYLNGRPKRHSSEAYPHREVRPPFSLRVARSGIPHQSGIRHGSLDSRADFKLGSAFARFCLTSRICHSASAAVRLLESRPASGSMLCSGERITPGAWRIVPMVISPGALNSFCRVSIASW